MKLQPDSELAAVWTVLYKEYGKPHPVSYMISFGYSRSPEEALSRVEIKLSADPFWKKKHAGGVFYALNTGVFLRVP